MAVTLYNTWTRQAEPFRPLDPKNVRVYVCGPTVYDFAHIGNARTIVAFDQLFRLLRAVYGEGQVTYARNITDVDDKINARAAETGRPISEITAETTALFHQDMAALGVLPPTEEPRATDHIAQMLAMIATLIDEGHAYEAEGHVLFDVSSLAAYGRLSGRSTDEMIAGARVEVAPYKKSPMDFVLWKPSEPDVPGWESLYGRGRPGWHIECSAMSEAYLGQTFDIHGGGVDLVFPHHENEIAQSTCAHGGKPMATVWMHAGYLMVEGQKMSKSLGNFKTVHDLLKSHPGEAIRLQLLSAHYRQPFNWTESGLKEAKTVLDRWYRALGDDAPAAGQVPGAVLDALSDDLNTPQAIAEMHKLAGEAGRSAEARTALAAGGALLGVLTQSPEDWFDFRPEGTEIDEAHIEALLVERTDARKSKDFARADAIRDELAAMGVVIEDGPQGTTWRVGS